MFSFMKGTICGRSPLAFKNACYVTDQSSASLDEMTMVLLFLDALYVP